MGLVIARFSAMTVALYEAERIMALVFESVYIIINIAINVARLIEKIVRINSRRIQAGLFHHQFVYYVKIQMAVQSVEDIIGMTITIGRQAAVVFATGFSIRWNEPEILLVMRRGLKMVYVRNVGRLPVLKIPVGLGRLVFMRVDKHMNAKLSGLFVDLCVEALVMI
ncbi:hypothetical protein Fcan01_22799 [Folsomia candida]|uniref:Uncharacterized protein n=1 Tax=Folsomia candida TaxID=158441 RepID=A0A226DCK1_FOLCA|nr:hypothetical protein Fcan01_22799 [Folsomia candida]